MADKLRTAGILVSALKLSNFRDTKMLHTESERFLDLLTSFLMHYKNGLHQWNDLQLRLRESYYNNYDRMRARIFLRIFAELFRAYEEMLADTAQMDFADMINLAIENVRQIPECGRGYRYVLLDEVQDLSRNRYLLIRAILKKNPGCRLFAVGDDWQSIYRFAGSDLGLVTDFERNFASFTRRSLIETTHRFGAPTTELSSRYIQRNPLQSRKRVFCSNLKKRTPIEVIISDDVRGDDSHGFLLVMRRLLRSYGPLQLAKKSIQIISRYNRDLGRLRDPRQFQLEGNQVRWHDPDNPDYVLTLDFCSMHKSKGITRDIVIVLNMNMSARGMPATRENDPLIELLLSRSEDYSLSEERRLFYVAITRARDCTYLIAHDKSPSSFLYEISEQFADSRPRLCPRCLCGELIKKQGKHGAVYYCSNYRYGCNYVRREAG